MFDRRNRQAARSDERDDARQQRCLPRAAPACQSDEFHLCLLPVVIASEAKQSI
jgi:hypothetical protein